MIYFSSINIFIYLNRPLLGMAEALITCTKCKKRSPLSQVRYSPNGEDLVCQACARPGVSGGGQSQVLSNPTVAALRGMGDMSTTGMANIGLRTPASSQPQLRSPPPSALLSSSRPTASPAGSSASKSIRYQCLSCNYKFTRTSKNENTCPYCNRKTLRKEFQLVSDVDEMVGHLGTY